MRFSAIYRENRYANQRSKITRLRFHRSAQSFNGTDLAHTAAAAAITINAATAAPKLVATKLEWFVPTGCLTFIALGVLFVGCIVFFAFSVLRSSDAYKTALARAKSDQRVVAALGTPIHDGLVPSGKTNVNGPSGEADIGIPISGPKGKATIYAGATKSEGTWSFSKLNVKIDATGETIDLNESGETANQSKETTENDETTDERIESITLAREDGAN